MVWTNIQHLGRVRDSLPWCGQVEEDWDCQLTSRTIVLTGLRIPHVTESVLADIAVLQPDVVESVLLEFLSASQLNSDVQTHPAFSNRDLWYSNEWMLPFWPTVRDKLCVILPLPVPASMTLPPTRTPRRMMM